jgi:hypothetical protein
VQHLDDNAASEFVSGSLPPSALAKVEAHLAACRDCRTLVAALAADTCDDSHAATHEHDRPTGSQLAELAHRSLTIGDRVARYLVLSSLGAGGMGVVFAAYDPQLDRKIALKLLRSGIAVSSKDARTRLRREAQAIAQLSHPNVVSIYDVGTTDDGDVYIAMEFVEGDTLTTWLRSYPRSWREIIDVFIQAARGLWAAHGVGLLHRDFKPDNVLVGGDGRVRVTDFGLARSVLAPDEVARKTPVMTPLDVALTATGTVLGTPRYMPPEQLTGPALDARSDQFSFCVALYEALYGRHPLADGTAVAMLERGDRATPPPEGTRVPSPIGRAVLRGLERDRSRRFPSMGALIDELVPAPRRSPVRFAGAAATALVVIGGTTAAVLGPRSPPPPVVAAAPDTARVEELTRERDRREAERQELVGAQAKASAAEVARLRLAVKRKDAEIAVLAAALVDARKAIGKVDARRQAARLTARSQAAKAQTALAAVVGPIEGCFQEWAERTQGTLDERPDAALVVKLTVTPDGVGANALLGSSFDAQRARARSDKLSGQSMLEMCVVDQIARVRFAPGPDVLDVEVAVHWWHPGLVTVSPHVTRQHPVRGGQIEL